MKKIRKFIVSIVFFGFSVFSQAGGYDDFFKAIQLDHPATVTALLERGFDPNTANRNGVPALLAALQEKSFKAAEALVEHPQTRIDVRTQRDESPLMLAALRGQESLVVKLVSRGAMVNKTGWTPLHYAATGGQLRVLAFLIGSGADVNAESPNGTTPLMMAAMYGNDATVKLLLESGANVETRNDQQLSAEDFAVRAGREDSARLIRQLLPR